jgi:hypothetical protein
MLQANSQENKKNIRGTLISENTKKKVKQQQHGEN